MNVLIGASVTVATGALLALFGYWLSQRSERQKAHREAEAARKADERKTEDQRHEEIRKSLQVPTGLSAESVSRMADYYDSLREPLPSVGGPAYRSWRVRLALAAGAAVLLGLALYLLVRHL